MKTWLFTALAVAAAIAVFALQATDNALPGSATTAAVRTETAAPAATVSPAALHVVKSRSCGCCGKWVDHVRNHAFAVTTEDVEDVSPFKQQAGITPRLASCHTAFVEGYVIEGHVPAADIQRLLAEKPDAIGLTVPGMPMGSPGMEIEGGHVDAYEVLLIERDGSTRVFSRYGI